MLKQHDILLVSAQRFEDVLKKGQQALQLAQEKKFDKGIMLANYQISKQYVQAHLFADAQPYALKSVELAQRSKDYLSLARFYTNLWSIYHHQGKFNQAVEVVQKSLVIYQNNNNQLSIADCYSLIGVSLQVQGRYFQALDYHQKALKINQTLRLSNSIATNYNNIGDIYENIKQYDEAIEYYQKSKLIHSSNQNIVATAICANGIASCYRYKGDYNKALEFSEQSLKIAERMDHKLLMTFALVLKAEIYILMKDYSRAYEYAQRGLKVNQDLGLKEGIVNNLICLGIVAIQEDKIKEAQKYLSESFDLSTELKLIKQISESAYLLAKCDSAENKFGSALGYYKVYKQYNDSLNNAEKSKEMGRLQASYQYELKIKDQNAERALEAERQAKRALFLGIIGVVALMFGSVSYYRFRLNAKNNRLLELKNRRIEVQKDEINKALEDLQHKNEMIEDSIRYAYQIQSAILPDQKYLQSILPANFIFYEPKDIVSGDFYWAVKRNDLLFLCVVDCTGHGVPGAFMSVIGANALHNTINIKAMDDVNLILQELDKSLKATLKQTQGSDSKDGMDIAICVFSETKCNFAAANRPLYYVQNGELYEIKGDKLTVGGGFEPQQKNFTKHEITLEKGDRFYLFTDGITDQFGGNHHKKFTHKRVQDFILNNLNTTMSQQGILFDKLIHEWMDGHKQLDDLTFIGIEIEKIK